MTKTAGNLRNCFLFLYSLVFCLIIYEMSKLVDLHHLEILTPFTSLPEVCV